MASEGTEEGRSLAVARVATRLFGSEIGPDAVIDESLQRATDDRVTLEKAISDLADTLRLPLPTTLSDEQLRTHPVAVWAELALGLDDRLELKRKKPVQFDKAVERLARDSGIDSAECRVYLENFLTLVSLPENQRGGAGDGAFLAFKLHRFISGASEIFVTLTESPRKVLFEGQLEDPDAPGNRLYPTRFCRSCGHEYHVVTKTEVEGHTRFLPRSIDDTPVESEDDVEMAGYLCPARPDDAEFAFDGALSGYPEGWLEERNGVERLRSYRKKRIPTLYALTPEGKSGADGKDFWFIPGKFAFCLCCKDEPNQGMRERSKLAGLSGEGRSSATTLLVSSA
ncbi:MAG: ATP-dependent helicase, partial [Oligoflexus sp.]